MDFTLRKQNSREMSSDEFLIILMLGREGVLLWNRKGGCTIEEREGRVYY